LDELKIITLIVRLIWRGFSIVILLIGVPSLLALVVAPPPAPPDPILLICLPIFAGGLIAAWRWEWLGGMIACFAIGTMEFVEYFQGKYHPDLVEYLVWVVGMLPLLSWSLETVKKPNVRPVIRLFSLVILPLIVVAMGVCIYLMRDARFNP
jgi:hypothetical protein